MDTRETERQLLGIALREPSALLAANRLHPSHFTDTPCSLLWGVLTRLHEAGEQTGDVSVIVREARRQGVYDRIGGSTAIADLVSHAGLSSSVRSHVDEIIRHRELDRLRDLAHTLVADASKPDADPAEIAGRFDAEVHATDSGESSIQTAGELIVDAMESIRCPEETAASIPTGIPSFDYASGLHAGEMLVLAARPSVGKSALASGIGLHAAREGHRVLMVNLEMTGRDVALRLLALETGQSVSRLRRGVAKQTEIEHAATNLQHIPLSFWTDRNVTSDRIRAVARLEQAREGLDLLVVDYIGLIRPTDPRKPRWEAMTAISGDLKTLALNLNIPIVVLCQLNRDAEGESPKLSHLREAGAIEQDADIVWLLERPRESEDATLHVAKIRNGRTGRIDLTFNGSACRFQERSPGEI